MVQLDVCFTAKPIFGLIFLSPKSNSSEINTSMVPSNSSWLLKKIWPTCRTDCIRQVGTATPQKHQSLNDFHTCVDHKSGLVTTIEALKKIRKDLIVTASGSRSLGIMSSYCMKEPAAVASFHRFVLRGMCKYRHLWTRGPFFEVEIIVCKQQ